MDGNGRVGRLLITLLLCREEEPLSRPLLYLSLYLKRNRDAYFEHLQRVRTHGEWEEWLRFFLLGVAEVARSTTETTRRLVELIECDRQQIHELGRASGSALRLHELATRRIVLTLPAAARSLEISLPTAIKAAVHLQDLGILRELTGRPRNRVYAYDAYLAILNED